MHERAARHCPSSKQVCASLVSLKGPVIVPLWDEFGDPPQAGKRLMHNSLCLRGYIFAAADPGSDSLEHRRSITQHGLLNHPLERDLRKPTFGFRVTASYVAMSAREPYLLQIFGATVWRRVPEVRAKESSALIYRYCVPTNGDVGIACSITQPDWVLDPANRAYGIPDADEVGAAILDTKVISKLAGQIEIVLKQALVVRRRRSLDLGAGDLELLDIRL